MSSSSDHKICLFEDDQELAEEILGAFAAAGMAIAHLTGISELRAIVADRGADVLIMDRMIGDFDSLELLENFRADGATLPVVVISSRVSVDDRILGLRKGGDDYLIKPFAMAELIARVDALRRRTPPPGRETELKVGALVLDRIDRTVRRGDRLVTLPPREFNLLEYLMRHAGKVVTRAMLLENVWNIRAAVQTNVVDVHIGNLRRKIEDKGESRLIYNVPGLGFRLVAGDCEGEGPGGA